MSKKSPEHEYFPDYDDIDKQEDERLEFVMKGLMSPADLEASSEEATEKELPFPSSKDKKNIQAHFPKDIAKLLKTWASFHEMSVDAYVVKVVTKHLLTEVRKDENFVKLFNIK